MHKSVGEKKMDVKEMAVKEMEEKRKYKYKHYQISFWFTPEVDEKVDDLSHYYVNEYLKELLNNDDNEFLFILRSEANKFFSNGYIAKRIYVDKELHDKFKVLPRAIKKRLYYLFNKKLLEVFKYGTQNRPDK